MTNITPRRETFCQAMLTAKDQSEAYRASFSTQNMLPATIHSKASILMADGKARARIAELRAPAVEAAQITLQSHLKRLNDLSDMAVTEKQYSAAIAAEVSRGKASGFYIDKREDVTDPFKKALSGMTVEKAQEMLDTLEQMRVIHAKAKSA